MRSEAADAFTFITESLEQHLGARRCHARRALGAFSRLNPPCHLGKSGLASLYCHCCPKSSAPVTITCSCHSLVLLYISSASLFPFFFFSFFYPPIIPWRRRCCRRCRKAPAYLPAPSSQSRRAVATVSLARHAWPLCPLTAPRATPAYARIKNKANAAPAKRRRRITE